MGEYGGMTGLRDKSAVAAWRRDALKEWLANLTYRTSRAHPIGYWAHLYAGSEVVDSAWGITKRHARKRLARKVSEVTNIWKRKGWI